MRTLLHWAVLLLLLVEGIGGFKGGWLLGWEGRGGRTVWGRAGDFIMVKGKVRSIIIPKVLFSFFTPFLFTDSST